MNQNKRGYVHNAQVQLCFSPNGVRTEAIVKQTDNTKSEIPVQAYSFAFLELSRYLPIDFNESFVTLVEEKLSSMK